MDGDEEILTRTGRDVVRLFPTRPAGVAPAVLLINPKTPANVGSVLRTCSCYGIGQLWYTGTRVDLETPAVQRRIRSAGAKKYRLPREERMKGYADCRIHQYDRPFDMFPEAVPVAVELVPGTIALQQFEHPAQALYVFGPEDDSLDRVILQRCHYRVAIPTRHCLNLAVAVATVLYDRQVKMAPGLSLSDTLIEHRGRAV